MQKFYILLIIIIVTASCSSEEKTGNSAPAINISQPVEGQVLQPGDNFEIVIDVSDDINLRQCIIEVHHNFDSHNHKATIDEEPWYFHRAYELKGKASSRIMETIPIPAAIGTNALKKGKYHFYVTAEDHEGLVTIASENIVIN